MREVDGYSAMEKLLYTLQKPEAVFCINDPVAVGAFHEDKRKWFKYSA